MQRKYCSFRVHCANYGKKLIEFIKVCKYYWLSTLYNLVRAMTVLWLRANGLHNIGKHNLKLEFKIIIQITRHIQLFSP